MSAQASFESAWSRLADPFRVCLGQAWESLRDRGLPVGAVLVRGSEIISVGRNRVYDPPGGDDRLQGTPIAHAEMNAFAALPGDVDPTDCELWTTQEPCRMCRATVDFNEIAAVRYLATDPAAALPHRRFAASAGVDDIWMVVANALFLHNVARVGGERNPIIIRNEAAEPEVVSLSQDLLSDRTLIAPAEAGLGIQDALAGAWESFAAAAALRRARLGTAPPEAPATRTSEPGHGVRFIYIPAVDLGAMRAFYGGLVGLDEIYFSGEEGSLAYDCAGLQFTIYRDLDADQSDRGWATQPGWTGNTTGGISWSVELSEASFRAAVRRLQAAAIDRLHEQPQWVGYWSFPVRDPMHNTVELSWPHSSHASSREWPPPS